MEEFISLKTAAELCDYSQEYLSLRARQGKLKAQKLGRNWFTKKEWLKDYIAQSGAYKESIEKKHVAKGGSPPSNLPVYAFDADVWEDNRPEETAQQEAFKRKLQFAAAYAMMLGLFFASIVQGFDQIAHAAQEMQETVFAAGAGEIAQEYIGWLRETVWRK